MRNGAGASADMSAGGAGPVRVLHVITSLDRGGAENHLYALLTHADRSRFVMDVAVVRGEGSLTQQFRDAGITVHHLHAHWRVDLPALGRLGDLLREGRYEIVHSHLFRADLYASLALSQLGSRRPRLVSTRHNDDRFFLHPLIGIVHYALSGSQDMIIAISDHIARFTIARGVQDPARVRRVYHGLHADDGRTEERDRARIRTELGVPQDAFLVGNVGRLTPQKGQRYLVAALPALLAEVPSVHLAIVGVGELREELEELAHELGVGDRVHVLGSRGDVPSFMRSLDVFAMPSIWEGFGIVLLEAMSAARPIVASRVATIPEVVVDGETGILTPPADPASIAAALTALAQDPALTARYGQAGRQRLRTHFSLDKMVGDTMALYDELLDPHPRAAFVPRPAY